MNIKEQKKSGISLIVLVITIIVMIILSAAIILSLDGSDIIERAKGAQSSNDVATAKEIVALAKSEWSFEKKEGYDTFREYAESKLEEAGFDMDNTYVEDSGKVLFDTAARFAKAGVEIGTEVQGYKLNNTITYTTSGNENTCELFEGMDYGTEGMPVPSTLTRDEDITWSYMGVDENGDILIVGNITSNSPTMMLGGFGAYLAGPKELDKACETMYSSEMGTARNINWNDVIRVLQYEGPLGMYYDTENKVIKTKKPLLIGEIGKQLYYNFDEQGFWTFLPDQRTIQEYKSELIGLSKNDNGIIAGETSKNLIFNSLNYWLSSSFVIAQFTYGASFEVRYVNNNSIANEFMVDTDEGSVQGSYYIRPVVKLDSNVKASYNGTVITLTK